MMTLDEDVCYRALRSRDARFDGKFFTGVTSTGIYCRPICPARTPKRENTRFFACAAAAEEAGFRPCRRCRPETSPGTPAWNGTGATVSRAVRLIESGYLEERGIEELATILGMGSRHLRRLFMSHLGASPKAIDMTRRTHLAASMLETSTLPVTVIAHSSGFASIRRFNDAFRASFGESPTELRARRGALRTKTGRTSGGHRRQAGENGGLSMRLFYRPPFDWNGLIDFYTVRAISGVESTGPAAYRRTARIGRWRGVITVERDTGAPALRVTVDPAAGAGLGVTVDRVRSMFDLRCDPSAVGAALREDPVIGPLIAALPGVRIPGVWDPFEAAIRAIVGQQISVKAAIGVLRDLCTAYGEPLTTSDTGLDRLFPTPERLADCSLAEVGMPRARKETIRRFARAVACGDVTFDRYESSAETMERLLAIPGIGQWTAHYVALRGLREPDAFPATDLVIRKTYAAACGNDLLSSETLLGISERWMPWRGYAAVLLWASASAGTTAATVRGRTSKPPETGGAIDRARTKSDKPAASRKRGRVPALIG